MSLAHSLTAVGWYPHQHTVDVLRTENESIALPGPLPDVITQRLKRLSHALSTAIAQLPQPDIVSHSGCVPASDEGIRLPLPKGVSIPLESTLSWTNPRSITELWKQLIPEIVGGWAVIADPLSASLLFLNDKDRLCYWPRLLNAILLDIPVSYGSVWDLFAVLGAFGLKIDLKSAFRSIKIDPADCPYLGAVVDGIPVTFTRLPFGLKCSPVVFVSILARTLSKISGSLHATRSALSSFVDDIAGSATTLDAYVTAAENIILALLQDGWWISLAKCFLFPAVRLIYIGFSADFPSRAVMIAPSKRSKMIELLCSIPVPDRSLTPNEPSIDTATTRSLRIAASSPGLAILHLEQDTPPLSFPHPPILSYSLSLPSHPPQSHSSPSPIDALVQATLTALRSVPPQPQRVPIISIDCPLAAVPDIACSLPPAVTTRCAVVLTVSGRPRSPPSDSWIANALRDLPPHIADSITAKIPASSPIPLPPQPTTTDIALTPSAWHSLRKLLGMLAWWQSIFKWLGYLRHPLDRTLNSGTWSTAAVAAVHTLRELLSRFHRLSASARRPARPLVVVVDSGRAWGAAIPSNTAAPTFCAGPLPLRVLGASSTVKEAWGARLGTCRALESPIASFDGLSVVVDSTALVGASISGSEVEDVNDALSFFAVLQMAGMPVDWMWERRSTGLHPSVDAFSSLPQPWPLRCEIKSMLYERFGRPTFLIGSSSNPGDATDPKRYATLRCGQEERDKVLDGITPTGAFGWMGPLGSLYIQSSELGFALPLWSQLPELWETWSTRPFHLTLVAPHTPALFWAPALARFQEAAQSFITLPPHSLLPPTQGRSPTAPDPRPLAAYRLVPSSPHSSPRESTTRGGREAFARASPNALNPGPTLVPSKGIRNPWRDSVADIARSVPTHETRNPDQLPTPPPRTKDPWSGTPAPPRAIPPRPPAHPPPPTERAHRTLGEWIEAVATFIATSAQSLDAVHPKILAASATLEKRPQRVASSRPARATEYMATLVAEAAIGDVPATPANIQATALMFVHRRLENPPPFGWSLVENAATVASDCSAIAAASTRAGIPVAPHCGPLVRALLEDNKAFLKKDHSAAYPLPLDVLLRAEPPKSQTDNYTAWSALVLMSLLCLRSGVLFHLTTDMLIPYAGGWLLIWRHSHKRAGSAPNDPLFLSPAVMVAGARHPTLDRILSDIPAGPLFPGLTSAILTTFIRSSIPGVHPAFDIRTYGARVSAAQDATILLVPGPLMRALFWWKQPELQMAEYYAGTNVLLMFAFSEARCHIQHSPLVPGYFAATLATPPPNWSTILVGKPPPLPSKPTITKLEAAWFATSLSFIAKRVQLAAYVVGRATKLLDRLLNCAGCKALVGPHGTAYLCDHQGCKWGLCPTCHPSGLDGTLLCPTHSD